MIKVSNTARNIDASITVRKVVIVLAVIMVRVRTANGRLYKKRKQQMSKEDKLNAVATVPDRSD